MSHREIVASAGLQRHSQLLTPALPDLLCEQSGRRVFKHLPELLGGYVSPGYGHIRRRAIDHDVGKKCSELAKACSGWSYQTTFPLFEELRRIRNGKRHNSTPPGLNRAATGRRAPSRDQFAEPSESDLIAYLPIPDPRFHLHNIAGLGCWSSDRTRRLRLAYPHERLAALAEPEPIEPEERPAPLALAAARGRGRCSGGAQGRAGAGAARGPRRGSRPHGRAARGRRPRPRKHGPGPSGPRRARRSGGDSGRTPRSEPRT